MMLTEVARVAVREALPKPLGIAFPFVDCFDRLTGLDKGGEISGVSDQHLKMTGGDTVAEGDNQRVAAFQPGAVLAIFCQSADKAGVVFHNLEEVLRFAEDTPVMFERISDKFLCERGFDLCFH